MSVKSDLARLDSRIYRKPTLSTKGVVRRESPRGYWWVLGYTELGKRCVLGPYQDDVEAYSYADKLEESEVFELKTKDQTKAVKLIRAILLKRGEKPDLAITRQLHEKGLARELSR